MKGELARHLVDQARALELRCHGMTYPEIAQEMEITPARAHNMVMTALRSRVASDVDRLRELEDARLDYVMRMAAQVMEDNRGTELGLKAVDRILRIGQARRQLWGLDLAQKLDVVLHQETEQDRELAEMVREAQARNAVVKAAIEASRDGSDGA